MKKYIFMALILQCSLNALAQNTEKIMVIHKSDGTTIEKNLFFNNICLDVWGKYTVNDDDYVTITNIIETRTSIVINVEFPYEGVLSIGEEKGVVWGLDKEEVINNKGYYASERIVSDNEGNPIYTYEINFTEDMPKIYDTPYYFRAYVTVEGITYYSEVQEYVCPPVLMLDQLTLSPGSEVLSMYGYYVAPTDEAFAELVRAKTGEECSDTSLYALQNEWLDYITPERAYAMDKTNGTYRYCTDCDVFLLNTVPEEFVQHVFSEQTFNIPLDQLNMSTYQSNSTISSTLTKNMVLPPTIVLCGGSWGVPENCYWQYVPTNATTGNPCAGLDMPLYIPGYTYKISVVFAPETNSELEPLPHKLRFKMFESVENELLSASSVTPFVASDGSNNFILDNAVKCDTVVYEWTSTNIRRNVLQIESYVRTTADRKKYSRTLRVVGVFVERKKM